MRLSRRLASITLAVAALFACSTPGSTADRTGDSTTASGDVVVAPDTGVVSGVALDTAVFGGGCFWCMEPPFDRIAGVVSTTSGYTGGTVVNPTYKQVSAGGTGHVEVVRIIFDPARVTYARLLDTFWRNIDPLTANRQFCDAGDMYRSAIFYKGASQRTAALASKAAIEQSGRFRSPIVTEIVQAAPFYDAEDYHQNYYRKNPIRYKYYRGGCGRDARLKELWGKPAA